MLTSRADMHCHSEGSPDRVYGLALRRGMQFVTLTDLNSIEHGLPLCGQPGFFLSVELTASFRTGSEPVHVMCWGITCFDHGWLQRHRADIEVCAAYLSEHRIACSLVRPPVTTPVTPFQRKRLAELFPRRVEVGGCGDPVGLSWTETLLAESPHEFLRLVRAGYGAPGAVRPALPDAA